MANVVDLKNIMGINPDEGDNKLREVTQMLEEAR
jgi:hypothetical protein